MPSPVTDVLVRDLLGAPLRHALAASGLTGHPDDHLPVIGVFSRRSLLSLPLSSPDEVRAAVAAAREAARTWGALRDTQRTRWSCRLQRTLAVRHAALLTVLQDVSGLGPADAEAELRCVRRTLLRHTVAAGPPRALRRRPRSGSPPPPAPRRPAVAMSHVDGARPLVSLLEGALPALLAGVTVVSETDHRTSVPTLAVLAAAREAGLPHGCWALAVDRQAADLRCVLAEHTDRVSPQCCAWDPWRRSPPGLLVLRHDGDARSAARATIRSCFARAGRRCAATPLVAVHEVRLAAFLEHLARETARFGPATALPHHQWRARLHAWTDAALDAGAQPVGSGTPPGRGFPLVPDPIVLMAPPLGAEALPWPPVGPVALLVRFSAWAEALDLARRTGPHLGVFTSTRLAQLAPQFAGLAATRIQLNAAPEAGLPPHQAHAAIGR
ncbi:aldehyde dehydrogenase family protein [Streptomyces sp. NPDC058989]|uniref:aldehyde dehydrogenase family protein n=1 Tax=Streptomyces sp. NPDC058989 TaxID=3346686 RepID=UPI0036755A3B